MQNVAVLWERSTWWDCIPRELILQNPPAAGRSARSHRGPQQVTWCLLMYSAMTFSAIWGYFCTPE